MFEYKKHTILGYSALDEENWISPISMKMVLSHHENMSGTGFPMKQKNKELECKIIQACDAFDCMICGMECKRISVQDAIKQMIDGIEVCFDKKVVKNLLSSIAKYPVGTTIKTNEQDEGVVVSQTIDPENPVIMIFNTHNNGKRILHDRLNLMLEKDISILKVISTLEPGYVAMDRDGR